MPPDDDGQQPRSDTAAAARIVLVESVISQLVYLGVSVAIIVAIQKRDELRGLYLRARRQVRGEAVLERHEAEVAAFRRQISEWEHQEAGR